MTRMFALVPAESYNGGVMVGDTNEPDKVNHQFVGQAEPAI